MKQPDSIVEFKEEQLVCVSYLVGVDTGEIISTNEHYNNKPEYKRNLNVRSLKSWIRVKFIDNDNTFVGEVEVVEYNTWSELNIKILEKGQHVKINMDRVHGVEDVERDFCYSDRVTQCDCPGLCRNK